jgi:hypothetical protein
MWPTVTANEAGGSYESRKKLKRDTGREQVTILNVVAADGWPTPVVSDQVEGRIGESMTERDSQLRSIAPLFPLAQAETTTELGQLLLKIIPIYCPRSHLSQWSKSLNEMSKSELQEVWESRPKEGKYRMKLNWKFSAWLMNIPIEHIACGLSETPSISESRNMPS